MMYENARPLVKVPAGPSLIQRVMLHPWIWWTMGGAGIAVALLCHMRVTVRNSNVITATAEVVYERSGVGIEKKVPTAQLRRIEVSRERLWKAKEEAK